MYISLPTSPFLQTKSPGENTCMRGEYCYWRREILNMKDKKNIFVSVSTSSFNLRTSPSRRPFSQSYVPRFREYSQNLLFYRQTYLWSQKICHLEQPNLLQSFKVDVHCDLCLQLRHKIFSDCDLFGIDLSQLNCWTPEQISYKFWKTFTGKTERISCSSPDWLLSQRYWNQLIVLRQSFYMVWSVFFFFFEKCCSPTSFQAPLEFSGTQDTLWCSRPAATLLFVISQQFDLEKAPFAMNFYEDAF